MTSIIDARIILIVCGVYFIAYMYYRGQNHDSFLRSQTRLNPNIGAINVPTYCSEP